MFYYIIIILIITFIFVFIKNNKKYETYETYESDNVTVVSGYWNVINKHGNDKYKEWFKNTLKIN